jgi:hypothetical protein
MMNTNRSVVRRRLALSALLLFLVVPAACRDSVAPNIPRDVVAGAYELGAWSFDPQGSLPEVDLAVRLAGLGRSPASLNLLADGQLQLLFQEPATGVLRLVNGTYRTTPTGAALDFGSNVQYRSLLLSQQMSFTRGIDGSLSFEDEAPAGVLRQALLALVPEWENEPTVDPLPGRLRVVFNRLD